MPGFGTVSIVIGILSEFVAFETVETCKFPDPRAFAVKRIESEDANWVSETIDGPSQSHRNPTFEHTDLAVNETVCPITSFGTTLGVTLIGSLHTFTSMPDEQAEHEMTKVSAKDLNMMPLSYGETG